ncbi:tyrosine--tRNA ligase [Patescibacteria group bacterium]
MKNIFDELQARGFVEQTNNNAGVKKLLAKPTTVYLGIDPSAPSLHIGNFVVIRALKILQKAGHKVILLVGGATGLVGDPTDKSKSRKKLDTKTVQKNVQRIRQQIQDLKLLDFQGSNPALLVNNYDWLSKIKFLEDFMLEIAPYFSVNSMVKFKTFAKRLKEEESLSLFEFVYPLMQAWDFLYLFKKHNCQLQIGGNDQWTNILEGVNLVRKKESKEVYAIGIPLLLTSSGTKMGKTEQGTIWLDKDLTSPFELYQALEKTSDELVEPAFKRITDLSLEEITKAMKGSPRDRQKKLAFEIVKVLHGEKEATGAQNKESMPIYSGDASSVEDILVGAKILNSKSEVRRRCEGKAVKFEGKKIIDPKQKILKSGILQAGKKEYLKIEKS